MSKAQLIVPAHSVESAWTLPANCVLWLSAAQSGDVAKSGSWTDFSGAGNHADLKNNAEVTGGELARPANSDWANVTPAGDFSGLSKFTALNWVKVTSGVGISMAGHYTFTWRLSCSTSNINGVVANTSFSKTGDVDDGAWHHWGIVYDGPADTLAIYRDGTLGTPFAHVTAAQGNTSNLRIGARGIAPPGQSFAGPMDEIMVFQDALTQELLTGIYTNEYAKG